MLRRNGFPLPAIRAGADGADEYVRQLKALAADYSTDDLPPRITADTLVIHGRQDRNVRFLADGIADAGPALIGKAGHCSPIEQPQSFTAVMRLW
jgi:pimeloyl-ACP methyl ester carboxylesterase